MKISPHKGRFKNLRKQNNTSLFLVFLIASTFSMAAGPAAERAVPWSRSVFRNKVEGERPGSVRQTQASQFWAEAWQRTWPERPGSQHSPQHVRAGQRMSRVCAWGNLPQGKSFIRCAKQQNLPVLDLCAQMRMRLPVLLVRLICILKEWLK